MQKRSLLMAGGAALLSVAAALGWASSGSTQSGASLVSMSGEELASNANILLVDIRTPPEWQQTGIIDGALLVTYSDADSFLAAIEPHLKPGQSLALVCRSGNRTSRAARQISGQIDVPVLDVAGGMIRVAREGYQPVPASQGIACSTC